MSVSSFVFVESRLSGLDCQGSVIRTCSSRRIYKCTKCGDEGHMAGICSARKVFTEAEVKLGDVGKSQSAIGGGAPVCGSAGAGKAVVEHLAEAVRPGIVAIGLVPLQGGACERGGGLLSGELSDAGIWHQARLAYGNKLALRAWHTAVSKERKMLGVLELANSTCFICGHDYKVSI
jgi:hypothetical protein